MPHSPNVSPSATAMTLQVCSYNAVSDTATVVYDLNDHQTTYLHAKSLAIAVPPQIETRSGNMRAQGEIVPALQYQNRHITMKVMVTGASSAAVESSVAALINAVKNENLPYCLALAWPGMSTYKYADVVRCKYTTPTDPMEIQSKICRNITLDFECRPGLRGDRVTLQNLVMNPGFEGPAGGGVATTMPTVFSDSFANTNAYSVVSGGAPSLNPANTYVDIVQANIPASGSIQRYYRMGEASGTVAYDISGSGQNGTYSGTFTLAQTGLLSGDTNTSLLGGASFKTTCPGTGLPSANAAWSYCAWFKTPSSFAATPAIMGFGGSNTSKMASSLFTDTSGHLAADVGNGTGQVTSTTTMATSSLHFGCVTWDGTTLRLYLDGASTGTPTTPGALSIPSNPALYVGANASAAAPWTGNVQDAVFYSGALSATQVSNLYTAGHTGATGTVANAMSIPAAAQVKFGSPAWGAVQTWQTRFRWVSGLTNASWYLHYTDANNYVRAWLSGTSLNLDGKNAGTSFTITSAVTLALTHEAWYWLQVTQFPCVPGTYPYVQAVLLSDNEGAVGSQIASIAGYAYLNISFSSQPQLAATGAALVIGGNYTSVHTVSLFGPGAWTFSSSGTGFASGAWDGLNAGTPSLSFSTPNTNPYSGGPVTSNGAARIDAAPAGTLNAQWIAAITSNATTIQQTAQPVSSAGDVLGVSVWVKSSGVGAGCTQSLSVQEYNSSGALLRTNAVSGASVTGAQASWVQFSGTYTTGASCAYAALVLSAVDATSGSAGGTVWWDNAQVWDQTTTGLTSMSYHELRFPNSPAQLMVSGLTGDIPTPAYFAFATYAASWSAGPNNKLTFTVGRRTQSGQAAQLVAWIPDAVSSDVLDQNSLGGVYAIGNGAGNGYSPFHLSSLLNMLKGVYHLFARAQTASATPSKVAARVDTLLSLTAYEGAITPAFEYIVGTSSYLFSAQNIWTLLDIGQMNVPAFNRGALASSNGVYFTAGPGIQDQNVSPANVELNWSMLLPVDGALLMGSAQPNSSLANPWLWIYADGSGVNNTLAAAINSSIEAAAIPAPNDAAGGPGTYNGAYSNANVSINSGADPWLTLDPTLSTTNAIGVNQFAALLTDQNVAVYTFVSEVQYAPLYLTLR